MELNINIELKLTETFFRTQVEIKNGQQNKPRGGSGGSEQDGAETDGEVLAVHLVGVVVQGHLLQVVEQRVQSALLRQRHRVQAADVLQQLTAAAALLVFNRRTVGFWSNAVVEGFC